MARGRSAVTDLMRFMTAIHISDSKLLLIQVGEMRLAPWMCKCGHRGRGGFRMRASGSGGSLRSGRAETARSIA